MNNKIRYKKKEEGGIFLLKMKIIKHLSWHPGTSVLKNTITHAFRDIMDTCIVVI